LSDTRIDAAGTRGARIHRLARRRRLGARAYG
jgi:hypothetical protein